MSSILGGGVSDERKDLGNVVLKKKIMLILLLLLSSQIRFIEYVYIFFIVFNYIINWNEFKSNFK